MIPQHKMYFFILNLIMKAPFLIVKGENNHPFWLNAKQEGL